LIAACRYARATPLFIFFATSARHFDMRTRASAHDARQRALRESRGVRARAAF